MSSIRYRYQTAEFGEHDIHYRTLRDRQQFSDDLGVASALGISSAMWPIFGVVWPSGVILARLMASYDIDSRRILEMGCGIGLASLVLNERMADISATDIHPRAGDFLQYNSQLNNGRHIPFFRTGWEDDQIERHGFFDLLIGSDLLYEKYHPKALSMFIKMYAKPKCEVLMVEAGRGYRKNFGFRMESLGFTMSELEDIDHSFVTDGFGGKVLRFRR
ncbi:MAG: protein N-lysine methyltransferase family protein [Pseudomonadales bacterium]|nr:protein N-lysine methyltransferase family protein [Pseudomonadales bacterium]